MSFGALNAFNRILAKYYALPATNLTLTQYAILEKRSLHRELYAVRSAEIQARKERYNRARITNALRGGSTKRLVHPGEFIELPITVKHPHSDRLVSDPTEVKAISRQYWSDLYQHNTPPDIPKPWLTTPSVLDIKRRVADDPFLWPRLTTLADFRALLRKGTPRPAPGRDEWEKWVVKNLPDHALAIVLKLHNYIVTSASFPGNIKDMWLTMFHKRGLRVDLTNWRGLLISNFLANSPMSWLNFNLVPYVARLRILPDTQVATQRGVQTRDLMSYLSAIKCWAKRHKTTVYALKRDQMKGFDYLSPQGMYDAIDAYGLPSAIADLDRAAQTNTKCYIRTAHGLTNPITISGLTKQGGSLSPIKSTLTTSLGHHYLVDLTSNDPDALVISSGCLNDPHLPSDSITSKITMVEATDDSYIFARTIPALRRSVLAMEHFQYAYGWQTQWSKSLAYVLEPSITPPDSLDFDTVTISPNINPLTISTRTVTLRSNELDFLRARVDDPSARYEELKSFIDDFTFPKFIRRPPITLIRKIVKQNIISKARALLSLQPIKRIDAEDLDTKIKMKIHIDLGMPFAPSSDILTLPIEYRGLDFPSVARINDAIAIDGLHRDLNHPIPSYRSMARITLSDWTCDINHCIDPLDGPGLARDFTKYAGKIPYGWIAAQKAMGLASSPISLKRTDIPEILPGTIVVSHALNIFHHHNPDQGIPDGNALCSLRLKGLVTLQDFGAWTTQPDGQWSFTPKPRPPAPSWSTAAKSNWEKVRRVLDRLEMTWFSAGDPDLIISRPHCQEKAERTIRQMAALSKLRPSPTSLSAHPTTWGSDGSMTPAAAGILDRKSVTSALTGPLTLVLKIDGRNISILQGELIGLIMGLILSPVDDPDAILYSDHLNSIRLIEDSRTVVDQRHRLRTMNARSYYRWILALVARNPLKIVYTRSHTDELSLPSLINYEADHYASSAQHAIHTVFTAPIPTFSMDDYTFHSFTDGWIESNIRNFIDKSTTRSSSQRLGAGHQQRMALYLYDRSHPPEWSYTHAYSAYSAVVQLYARSGQLPTTDTLHSRGKLTTPDCRMGCSAIEDMHHIFVDCQRYTDWRAKASCDILTRTKAKLAEKGIEEADCVDRLLTAKSLFSDSPVWPLQYSAYYLGHIPRIDTLVPRNNELTNISHSRLIHHFASDWHTACIRLVGRIWGDWQKEMSMKTNSRSRRK
jgi:hypothetical protein